jgi:hypothetical protein
MASAGYHAVSLSTFVWQNGQPTVEGNIEEGVRDGSGGPMGLLFVASV